MENLIQALGGSTAVANAIGAKPGQVNNWRERGVPWKWRLKVAALARQKGVVLPGDFLHDAEAA